MGLGRTGLWPCCSYASMSYVIWGKLFTLSEVWNRTGIFFHSIFLLLICFSSGFLSWSILYLKEYFMKFPCVRDESRPSPIDGKSCRLPNSFSPSCHWGCLKAVQGSQEKSVITTGLHEQLSIIPLFDFVFHWHLLHSIPFNQDSPEDNFLL